MTENELISGIIYTINKYLPAYGIKDFIVSRNGQLSDQFVSAGIDSNIKTHIFVHQQAHKVIQNSPTVIYDKDKKTTITNRSALVNISVLKNVNPSDIKDYTCEDIAEIISDMFFNIDVILDIRKRNIRIENRTGIIPRFFINESDRYEFIASFNLGITYESVRILDYNKTSKISHKVNNI